MSKISVEKNIVDIYKRKRFIAEQDAENRFNKALEEDAELKRLFLEKRRASCESIMHETDENRNAYIQALKKFSDYVKKKGLDLSIHYECDKCKDSGWIDKKECDCRKSLKKAMLRQESNLPKMANETFDNDKISNSRVKHAQKMSQIIKDCKMFVEKFDETKKRVLLLSGGVGVGKTTLSFFIANALLEKGKSVYYSNAFDLATMLMNEQFRRLSSSEYVNYCNMVQADLLIIDDLGVEQNNAILIERLFALIDKRMSDGMKTMICTNLSFEQISKRYGERIYSRLLSKEYSYCPSFIAGDDLRKTIL